MAEATGKRRQKPKKRAKRAGGRSTLMFLSSCVVSIVLGYALGEYAVQLVNDGRFHLPGPRSEPLPLTLAPPAKTADDSAQAPAAQAEASGAAPEAAAAGETESAVAVDGADGVSADVASQLDTSGGSTAQATAQAALYRVQVGDYADRAAADAALKRLDPQGKNGYYIVAGPPYRVQVGAFSDAVNAGAIADGFRAQGLAVVILES